MDCAEFSGEIIQMDGFIPGCSSSLQGCRRGLVDTNIESQIIGVARLESEKITRHWRNDMALSPTNHPRHVHPRRTSMSLNVDLILLLLVLFLRFTWCKDDESSNRRSRRRIIGWVED
ncbi:hypothetical protein BDN70DRAFT_383825 [Pholiota conissans]|uniref:Uncharacterized protein n=1 Tax=Pholiota conissans TaxID=109636 RepID=A0A9P6CP03_9AGAR|nr:hypothetical protein BDN70DRAFT_383825 [Pholiota conissans]